MLAEGAVVRKEEGVKHTRRVARECGGKSEARLARPLPFAPSMRLMSCTMHVGMILLSSTNTGRIERLEIMRAKQNR